MDTGQRRSSRSYSTSVGSKVKVMNSDPNVVELDFLMPNSFIISLSCDRRASLGSLKPQIWTKALQLPAANYLRDSAHYVFIGVMRNATEVQLEDSLTVRELELMAPILEVSEPKSERDLNRLLNAVGEAIGIPVTALDAQSAKDKDLQELRSMLRRWCHSVAEQREQWAEVGTLWFFYPPKLDLNMDLPFCTEKQMANLPEGLLTVIVYLIEDTTHKYEVKVLPTSTPVSVAEETVRVRNKERGRVEAEAQERVSIAGDIYVVKVCGREEYMLQDCCLHSYQYIRSCINRNTTPILQLVPRMALVRGLPDNSCIMLQQELPEVTQTPSTDSISSWEIMDKLSIRVNNMLGKVQDASMQMNVNAGIYCGNQALCDFFRTSVQGWKQPWSSTLDVNQLPRTARLCFTVHISEKNRSMVLSWVNHPLFDQSGRLTTGSHRLGVWTMDPDNKTDTYPHGTPGGNTDKNAPIIDFEIIAPCSEDVYFPSEEFIDSRIDKRSSSVSSLTEGLTFEKIDDFVKRDIMKPLSPKERRQLWKNRYFVVDYNSNILPRLVQCVDWTDRHEVAELYGLLNMCSSDVLNLTSALQLLGYEYTDTRVRSLAVKCLRRLLKPPQLELYLLQLAQTLKFETYPYNATSLYLLDEALRNRRIGHRLFWILRSEMDVPLSRKLYSPLLEVYCLYCGSTVLQARLADVRCVTKYQNVSQKIKQKSSQDDQTAIMKEWLSDESTRQVLEQTAATLDPDLQLGHIWVDECRVMMSKMRPLWITWQNRSQLADKAGTEKIKYIIKNGDDLRQDMLVIQLVRVMDMLWKYGCHDYWLTIYDCISLGKYIGIIEVVGDAETVCNIHMEKQGMAQSFVGNSSLQSWLYENTKGTEYMDAVKRFSHSCAGYCVATYILGVKDRHSDNIMVSKNGQLFHIDFGHIMDHKKTKLGISRERTPFVLTEDFIRVICRGSGNYKKNDQFLEFQYLCFEAYMTIRRHANLFMTLLNLMLHSNLPELKDSADIDYCRRSLALGVPEHEAGKHFLEMFFRSYEGQWKTNVDWFFHRFNRVTKSKPQSR